MKTSQTTSATESHETNGANGDFPADVVAFAIANQVEDCLQPLLEATQRIFPTARFVKVQIDDDPEIRDLRHILYNVQVAGLALNQSLAAESQWIKELLRICLPVRACVFRLGMDLKR